VRENRNGNDSTITRFGWKAQNKSLQLFAAEAYNVEQGVTNEIFPNERSEAPRCHQQGFGGLDQFGSGASSDLILFAAFLRLLSDHLLHDMGPGLAGIAHCAFGGLGQRIFSLHDGRTKDLIEAIGGHAFQPPARGPEAGPPQLFAIAVAPRHP